MIMFSKRLKELRNSNHLTQKELGKLIGVTKVSVCCYENGSRTPTLETLIDIADALNVDLPYLLGIDNFVVSEDDQNVSINISKNEIEIIRELRTHIKLYEKLIDDPKRTINYLEQKIR